MATSSRPQTIQQIGAYLQDGNRTRMRHARYGVLYLGSGQIVGGVQTYHQRQTNGTHLEPEGGSDWNETVVGQRQFSVQCRRQSPRGSDIEQMVKTEYPLVQDVDFRDLPFMLAYFQNFTSATGGTTYEAANWQFFGVTINDYDLGYDNPNGLIIETFTAISTGYLFTNGLDNARNTGMSKALLPGGVGL